MIALYFVVRVRDFYCIFYGFYENKQQNFIPRK